MFRLEGLGLTRALSSAEGVGAEGEDGAGARGGDGTAVSVGTGGRIGYDPVMTYPDLNPVPQEWLDVLERSRAEAQAGLVVPMEAALTMLDAELAELEAELAARSETVHPPA